MGYKSSAWTWIDPDVDAHEEAASSRVTSPFELPLEEGKKVELVNVDDPLDSWSSLNDRRNNVDPDDDDEVMPLERLTWDVGEGDLTEANPDNVAGIVVATIDVDEVDEEEEEDGDDEGEDACDEPLIKLWPNNEIESFWALGRVP